MLRKLLLFCFFAMLSLAWAAKTPLEKFVDYSFEPDQNVSYQKLLSKGDYYLVIADSVETYIVSGSGGPAINNTSLATEILQEDAKNRKGFEKLASSLAGLGSEILKAKEENEKKCMLFLGLDRMPCSDKESCILSCFSVPLCSGVIYADGFLEAFMEWNENRQKFGSLVSQYSENIDSIAESNEAASSKLQLLEELHELSINMSKNQLFLNRTDEGCSGKDAKKCYEYCPKIDYSTKRIERAIEEMQALRVANEEIAKQAARAQAIVKNTLENEDYLSRRGREYAELKMRMWSDLRSLNRSFGAFSLLVEDPIAEEELANLSNLSSKIERHADAGEYRKALAAGKEFEALRDRLSARMTSGKDRLIGLNKSIGALKRKVDGAEWLIGNESAEAYRQEIALLEAGAAAVPSLEEISEMENEAVKIRSKLNEEISLKLEERGQNESREAGNTAQPVRREDWIPPACASAMLILAGLAAAFCRR
ncbi:MAG: hypothetical protein N3G22_01550 [Candidatus Micrarchaeota archaeon]|nr:hypothetical protein [Candidatus Micrarchaeota archaeon]